MELRHRIFRLLEERELQGGVAGATIGDILQAIGERRREVLLVLKSSEALGMLSIHRYLGTDEKDFAVFLKPAAYIYLESGLNRGR